MAGNPYELQANNPQTENRLVQDGTYPPISGQSYPVQQGYQPNQHQQPYPNQPMYPNQPPVHANQPSHPNLPITQEQMVATLCPACNTMTASYVKKAIGPITWAWCFGLWCFTGICCWIPFICDDCKENQITCVKCHTRKATV